MSTDTGVADLVLGDTAAARPAMLPFSYRDGLAQYTDVSGMASASSLDGVGHRHVCTSQRDRGRAVSRPERDIDADLVARVQRGDKRAFDLLVLKYQRRIMRLLARMVRSPSDIEDVAQETFIKAYRALPQFRGDSAFYTWLYRIAINTARNWHVAQMRRPQSADTLENDEGETFDQIDNLTDINTPEAMLASQQVAETINSAMAELPDELRTAIVLREVEGMSYEDIAQTMGCPIGTVRSRIFRARDVIARKLRPVLESDPDHRW